MNLKAMKRILWQMIDQKLILDLTFMLAWNGVGYRYHAHQTYYQLLNYSLGTIYLICLSHKQTYTIISRITITTMHQQRINLGLIQML